VLLNEIGECGVLGRFAGPSLGSGDGVPLELSLVAETLLLRLTEGRCDPAAISLECRDFMGRKKGRKKKRKRKEEERNVHVQ
jgi:hypothetical protein